MAAASTWWSGAIGGSKAKPQSEDDAVEAQEKISQYVKSTNPHGEGEQLKNPLKPMIFKPVPLQIMQIQNETERFETCKQHGEMLREKDPKLKKYTFYFPAYSTEVKCERALECCLYNGLTPTHQLRGCSLFLISQHSQQLNLNNSMFVLMQGIGKIEKNQRINFFDNKQNHTSKDRLWDFFCQMRDKYGKNEWSYMPTHYFLPQQTSTFLKAFKNGMFYETEEKTYDKNNNVIDEGRSSGSHKNSPLWISKPTRSAKGHGIVVIGDEVSMGNHLKAVQKESKNYRSICPLRVVCKYISNPFLICEHKFDLRLMVVITSFDPLRIYLHSQGVARFAALKYSNSTKTKMKLDPITQKYVSEPLDVNIHLTNVAVNQSCRHFKKPEPLHIVNEALENDHGDVKKIWSNIIDLICKSMLSIQQGMMHNRDINGGLNNFHEIFGYDVLLDSFHRPWLMEINRRPNLHGSGIDLWQNQITKLYADTFNLVGIMPSANSQLKAYVPPSDDDLYFQYMNRCNKHLLQIEKQSEMLLECGLEFKRCKESTEFIRIFPCQESFNRYKKIINDNGKVCNKTLFLCNVLYGNKNDPVFLEEKAEDPSTRQVYQKWFNKGTKKDPDLDEIFGNDQHSSNNKLERAIRVSKYAHENSTEEKRRFERINAAKHGSFNVRVKSPNGTSSNVRAATARSGTVGDPRAWREPNRTGWPITSQRAREKMRATAGSQRAPRAKPGWNFDTEPPQMSREQVDRSVLRLNHSKW